MGAEVCFVQHRFEDQHITCSPFSSYSRLLNSFQSFAMRMSFLFSLSTSFIIYVCHGRKDYFCTGTSAHFCPHKVIGESSSEAGLTESLPFLPHELPSQSSHTVRLCRDAGVSCEAIRRTLGQYKIYYDQIRECWNEYLPLDASNRPSLRRHQDNQSLHTRKQSYGM